jgi:hypothetical protein
MPSRALVALGLALAMSLACAWLPIGPRAIGDCPGPLVATEEIPGNFLVQHRLRAVAEDVDFPLRSVLQKQQGEIVFIGSSALGAKLFTVRQTGRQTEVEALPAAVLPIAPLNLLRDLHRVMFAAEAGGDGNGLEPRAVVERSDGGGSKRALVRHPACGYTLEVEELHRQALP